MPGTFFGFFHGAVRSVTDVSYQPPSGPFMFTTVEGNNCVYIDNSTDYTACYSRYYSSSTKAAAQNVAVVRVASVSNPNNQICFVANKFIQLGEELVIGVDQGYLRNGGYRRYKTATCDYSEEYVTKIAQQYLFALQVGCGSNTISAEEVTTEDEE